MPFFRAGQVCLVLATLAITPAFGSSRPHHATTAAHTRLASTRNGKKKAASKLHGQRAIDSDRAAEIQSALIKQKYLNGAPTRQWDSQTQTAMKQYQSDHGWQTKLTPDSRALISLGLGPNHTEATPIGRTTSTAPKEPASQQGAEPQENTLASVNSLSQ